jgi:hypothetical protein
MTSTGSSGFHSSRRPLDDKDDTVCSCAGNYSMPHCTELLSLIMVVDDPVLVCRQMWIAKNEYDESGPSIVHRKCF